MNQSSREDGSGVGSKFACCLCCCIFLVFSGVFSSIFGTLYAVSPPPEYDTTLYVVPDDWVKIEFEEARTYDFFIGRSISVSSEQVLDLVNIHQANCKDINDNFTKELVSESPFVVNDCIWRCEIDIFVYFVNSEQSFLSYNITIHPYSPEITGRFVLFDNYSVFTSYLNGSDEETGIVQQTNVVLSTNTTVTIDYQFSTMDKSSYYFIAFEELNKTLTRIDLSGIRSARQVIYNNIEILSSTCLDECNHLGLYQNAHKQCFFLSLFGFDTVNQAQPVNIHYGYDEPITIAVIIAGGFVAATGCCCCCCCCCCLICVLCAVVCDYFNEESQASKDQEMDQLINDNDEEDQHQPQNHDVDHDHNDDVLYADVERLARVELSLSSSDSENSQMKFISDSKRLSTSSTGSDKNSFCDLYSLIPVENYPHARDISSSVGTNRNYDSYPATEEPLDIEVRNDIILKSVKDNCDMREVHLESYEEVSKAENKDDDRMTSWLSAQDIASPARLKGCKDFNVNATKSQNSCNCAECNYDVISFEQKGLFYHSNQHGVTIIIPEGAVKEEASLQFGACLLMTNFKCEGLFSEPVSPFIWIHTDAVLSKPIDVYIPLHVVTDHDSPEDRVKLHLLTRGHEDKDVFKVNNGIRCTIGENLAKVSATHFCSFCLATKPLPKKRYMLLPIRKELKNGTHHFDVCALYSYKCLEELRKQYIADGYKVLKPQQLSFQFREIKMVVDLPVNAGWDYSYRDYEFDCIKEEEIDLCSVLDCTPDNVNKDDIEALGAYEKEGSYPPRFKLSFFPINSQNKRCQAKIVLTFAERNITLPLDLPGMTDYVPGSPISLVSSIDSGFANGSQRVSDLLNTEFPRIDDWFFVIMTFLETKLMTSYMMLGHNLGFEMDELHRIKLEMSHDERLCTREILFEWKRRSPNATHQIIAEALNRSGYYLMSKMINHHFDAQTTSTLCHRNNGCNINELDLLNCVLITSAHNTINSAFDREPLVREFTHFIVYKIPAEWKLFGTQLGIEKSQLDAVKKNNLGDCNECFLDVFDLWKKNPSSEIPFTWSSAIKVLFSHSFGEYTVAENIYAFLEKKMN